LESKKEIRTLPATELRTDNDGGRAVITGHAAVFGSWSETLGGFFPFKEKVQSGRVQEKHRVRRHTRSMESRAEVYLGQKQS